MAQGEIMWRLGASICAGAFWPMFWVPSLSIQQRQFSFGPMGGSIAIHIPVCRRVFQVRRLYVIPGFYGADAEGEIVTFSRGGSDITGAIVARAVGAEVYENWTDVSGLLMADPRMV